MTLLTVRSSGVLPVVMKEISLMNVLMGWIIIKTGSQIVMTHNVPTHVEKEKRFMSVLMGWTIIKMVSRIVKKLSAVCIVVMRRLVMSYNVLMA